MDTNKALIDWFSDSKVVDAHGKPLVVYHGTATEFKKFGSGNSQTEGGAWLKSQGVFVHHFTNKKEVALEFAEMVAGADRTSDDRVISALLLLRSPLIIDASGRGWTQLQEELIEAYKEGIHDGAIFKNIADSAFGESISDTYICFNENQIKIVCSNILEMSRPLQSTQSQKPLRLPYEPPFSTGYP